jgi:hypothetical protein
MALMTSPTPGISAFPTADLTHWKHNHNNKIKEKGMKVLEAVREMCLMNMKM